MLFFILFLQKFFLQGRFIFGPDVRSLALTILLIVAPVAVFCVFVARKLMDDFSDHWGVSIMAVAILSTIFVSLFLSSTCAVKVFFFCVLLTALISIALYSSSMKYNLEKMPFLTSSFLSNFQNKTSQSYCNLEKLFLVILWIEISGLVRNTK